MNNHEKETFMSITKKLIKQQFCKHTETHALTCPYTHRTYTDCSNCERRLKIEPAKEG